MTAELLRCVEDPVDDWLRLAPAVMYYQAVNAIPPGRRLKVEHEAVVLENSAVDDAHDRKALRAYHKHGDIRLAAHAARCTREFMRDVIRRYSVKTGNKVDLPVDEVVLMYNSGVSEQAIAEVFRCSRGPVRRVLLDAGVDIRGRSAAMLVRWSKMSDSERSSLIVAAHSAALGRPKSDATRRLMAATKSRRRGVGETIIADALSARGDRFEDQAAVDFYNIDILLDGVAVEPHCSSCNPMRNAHRRERTKHLLRREIATLWVIYKNVAALRGCLDQVIANIDEMRRDPPAKREHRVIRCALYRFARVRNELGQLTAIPAPERFECRRVE